MASPLEKAFLSGVTERKRKRCDIKEGLQRLRNVSISDLQDLCSALDKEDILMVVQAKLPNAIKLAEIIRVIPSAMPKATKDTLLAYYFKKLDPAGDIDIERLVNVLLFCTADLPRISCNGVREIEILTPPVTNCCNCKSLLVAQNKIGTVTVFSGENVKTAMKLSLRCKDCKLNYGYSMFGNIQDGYHFSKEERPYVEASDGVFMERSLCLFQVSLANHAWVSFVGFAESYTEVFKNTDGLPAELQQAATKQNGCENFVCIDGIWKLRHPHCLYPVKADISGLPTLNYPNVCTEEPETQASAFCAEHSELAKEKNMSTNLRAFIHDYCRVPRNPDGSDPSDVNLKNAEKINEIAGSLQSDSERRGSSAAESQGTETFISEHNSILQDCEYEEATDGVVCNKDTGENQKTLRKWSRGLLHFVRGGGHIERWCPLYVSEGPGQVFLITIQYLLKRLEGIDESKWEDVIVAYDNMCNLDKLRIARKPLPFPEPYNLMWLKVRKIVDRLHMKNHKNPECKVKYGSDDLKEKFPRLNTPVAEQTFIWSGRFKKIMCAMPKRRFLFFYHRMVKHRNKYISDCYKENGVPDFPAIHGNSQ